MAKFSKGDKVESVKTGAKGVVDEVYGDEKYAVLFDGATNPDKVEGFQIKAANGCARNSAAARSTNAVVQNAINARTARNATVKIDDAEGAKRWDALWAKAAELKREAEALDKYLVSKKQYGYSAKLESLAKALTGF